MPNYVISSDQIHAMQALKTCGFGQCQIARALGITRYNVQYNLDRRKCLPPSQENPAAALRRVADEIDARAKL